MHPPADIPLPGHLSPEAQAWLAMPRVSLGGYPAFGVNLIRAVIAFFADGAAHRSYPVVDPAGQLQGLVSRSDGLHWKVEGDLDEVSLAEARNLRKQAEPVRT
jgi:hypothetical protein